MNLLKFKYCIYFSILHKINPRKNLNVKSGKVGNFVRHTQYARAARGLLD